MSALYAVNMNSTAGSTDHVIPEETLSTFAANSTPVIQRRALKALVNDQLTFFTLSFIAS